MFNFKVATDSTLTMHFIPRMDGIPLEFIFQVMIHGILFPNPNKSDWYNFIEETLPEYCWRGRTI